MSDAPRVLFKTIDGEVVDLTDSVQGASFQLSETRIEDDLLTVNNWEGGFEVEVPIRNIDADFLAFMFCDEDHTCNAYEPNCVPYWIVRAEE